jgi:para-aminobenzoate synthetase/4-amino-4-deoxychorismate lyase
MKGTAGRGKNVGEDEEIAALLQRDEKERAENLMIVDLLRNDLGRISENGSVTVNSLFDVETFETVHQMTSTVSSRLRPDVGLVDMFRALFPCGSITGAPKKRSMEIIAELEDVPRGLYTGCIGYISPVMSQAVFSVAIRTVVIDKEYGTGVLGVGSGITWYSSPDAEFEECLAKGNFAQNIPRGFTLIESLLFEKGSGYFLLERHLDRLAHSADYFGFQFDPGPVRTSLEKCAYDISESSKVRLLLTRDGSVAIEVVPLVSSSSTSCPTSWVTFADQPIDSSNRFLYHKTSNREMYRLELEKKPDCVDVIFLNERGEVTEGANNNIVIRKDGILLTPPVTCGLLPGTLRAQLLETGEVSEGVIMPADVAQADEIYLINSVRKWRRVRLAGGEPR